MLRAAHPAIEIVCAPTPEIDAVFAAMRERMDAHADTEQTYLSDDIGANAVASFFRAAVPSDHSWMADREISREMLIRS